MKANGLIVMSLGVDHHISFVQNEHLKSINQSINLDVICNGEEMNPADSTNQHIEHDIDNYFNLNEHLTN